MRLINADALSRAMYHEAFEKDTDLQKWDSGCWIRYKMFENKIEEAPTIDVLDKIKAEIEGLTYYWCEVNPRSVIDDVLKIVDKYRNEVSE